VCQQIFAPVISTYPTPLYITNWRRICSERCSECRIPTVKILVRPWPKIGLHRHGLMPAAPWPSTSLEGGTSCSRMTLRAIGRPCRFSMKTRPAPVRFQGLFGRHSLSLSFLSKQRRFACSVHPIKVLFIK
jgi:hypothetical protein